MRHAIVSDLDDFIRFNEWVEQTCSPETYSEFLSNKDSELPSAQAKVHVLYMDWIKDQKITHTITEDDGTVILTCYKDLE